MNKILIAGLIGSLALVPQLASANGYYGYGYHHANPWPYIAGALTLGVVGAYAYDHPRVVEEYPAYPQTYYAPPQTVYVAPPQPQPYTCTYYPDGSRICN